MNKIFRIVFNKARGMYVVVSELTKPQGKSTRGRTQRRRSQKLTAISLAVSTLVGALSMTNAGGAQFIIFDGAVYYSGQSSHKANSIAFNPQEGASDIKAELIAEGGVAVGSGSQIDTTATSSVAIGQAAAVWGSSQDSVALGHTAIVKNSSAEGVAIGHNATVIESSPFAIAVGGESVARGNQAVAIGNKSNATAQSVALGADTYAVGESAIAIGNDDLVGSLNQDDTKNSQFVAKLQPAAIKSIYQGLITNGIMTQDAFNQAYIESTSKQDMRVFSPNYAGGRGAISIGSRTVASADLSTAVGSLSFALANRSTAVGINAYVDSTATGATAIGDKSFVFAPNSIAIGNNTQSSNQGTVSYGFNAYAVAPNSMVLGQYSVGGGNLDSTFLDQLQQNYKALSDSGKLFQGSMAQIVASIKGKNPTLANQLAVTDPESFFTQNSDGTYAVNMSTYNKFSSVTGLKALLDKSVQFRNSLVQSSNTFFVGNGQDGSGLNGHITATAPASLTIGKEDVKKKDVYQNSRNTVVLGNRSVALDENATTLGYSSSALGKNAVALGAFSAVDKDAVNGLSIGAAAYVNSASSLGIGSYAAVTSPYSSAIGRGSGVGVKSDSSLAVGDMTQVYNNSKNAIAIGALATVGDSSYQPNGNQAPTLNTASKGALDGIAIGYSAHVAGLANDSLALGSFTKVASTAPQSVALGTNAVVSSMQSVALGNAANVEVNAQQTLALGYNAHVYTGANSAIAVGSGANVYSPNSTAIGTGASVAATAHDSIVFGNSAKSTDKAPASIVIGPYASTGISTTTGDSPAKYTNDQGFVNYNPNYPGTSTPILAVADGATRSANSIVIGVLSTTGLSVGNAVVVGTNSHIADASGASNLIGYQSSIGHNSWYSNLIGYQSRIASGSAGNSIIGYNSQIGYTDDPKTNQTGIDATGSNFGNNIIVGSNSYIYQGVKSSVALGNRSSATVSNSVALGFRSTTFYKVADKNATISHIGDTYDANTLDPYAPSGSSYKVKPPPSTGVISVGGYDAGGNTVGIRRIINVAPGALDTDVATVGQLRSLEAVRKGNNLIYYYVNQQGHRVTLRQVGNKFYEVNPETGEALSANPGKVEHLDTSDILMGGLGINATFTTPGTAVMLGNIADGTIAQESDKAITGNQVNQLVTSALGLSVDSTQKSVTVPSFTGLKTGGTVSSASGTAGNATTTVKAAIDANITALNKGLLFAGDNTSPVGQRFMGDTFSIKSGNADNGTDGNNISTKIGSDGNLVVGVKQTPTFKGVNIGSSTTDNSPVHLTKSGSNLSVGNVKVTNVSAGTVGASSTDAINGKQLSTFASTVLGADVGAATQSSFKNIGGTDTTAKTFKQAIDDTIAGVNKLMNNTVTLNGKQIKLSENPSFTIAAKDGSDLTVDNPSSSSNTITIGYTPSGSVSSGETKGVSGQKIYTAISGARTTLAQESNNSGNNFFTIKDGSSTDGINPHTYTIGLNVADSISSSSEPKDHKLASEKAVYDAIQGLSSTLSIKGDPASSGGEASTGSVDLKQGALTFQGNSDITVKASGTTNATVSVGLQKAAAVSSNDERVVTSKAVANALTVVQSGDGITVTPTSPEQTGRTTYTVALGSGLKDKIDNAIQSIAGDANITVEPSTGTSKTIKLNPTLTGITSISGTGTGTQPMIDLSGAGVSVNNHKITNVAKGTETNDAVNYGQLQDLQNKVDSLSPEITYKANGASTQKVALTQGFDFKDGTNTTAHVDSDGGVSFSVKPALTGITSISGNSDGASGKGLINFTDGGISIGNGNNSATATVALKPTVTDSATTLTLSNGSGNNPVKLTGLADGSIADTSKDAVTGGQISTLAKTVLGVDNITSAPTFTAINGATPTPSTVVGAINATIEAINQGLHFDADPNQGGPKTNKLNSTIKIVSADKSPTTSSTDAYVGDNLQTSISQDSSGNTTIKVGFKEAPTFQSVTVGGSSGVKLSVADVASSSSPAAQPAPATSATHRVSLTDLGSSNGPVVLGNIANGITSTDAVNLSQLGDIATALGGGAQYGKDGHFQQPSYTVNNQKKTNVGDAITALDAGITFASDNSNSGAVKAGDTFNIKGKADSGISTTVDGSSKTLTINYTPDASVTEHGTKAVSGSGIYSAISGARTTVAVDSNSQPYLTINPTSTSAGIGGLSYTVGINVATSLTGDNLDHKLPTAKAVQDAINGLSSTLAIQGNPSPSSDSVATEGTVNLTGGHLIIVGDSQGQDITATVAQGTSPNEKDSTVTLHLNKATSVASGDDKVVTAGAVQSALDGLQLSYKDGTSPATTHNTKLSDGLTFNGDSNITATAADSGAVTYTLNPALTGITSISGTSSGLVLKGKTGGATLTINNDIAVNQKKVTGLADGSIDEGSKDAVTGGQISKLAKDVLGVSEDGTFSKQPPFVAVNGSGKAEAPTTIVGAITDTISALNKGLKFGADTGDEQTNQLGSTIKVVSADKSNTSTTATSTSPAYVGDNLQTTIAQDGGNTTIKVGFKDAPSFKSIALVGADSTIPGVQLGVEKVTAKPESSSPTPDGATQRLKFTNVGTDSKHPVILGNVAAGEEDTDAVNLKQLNAVKDAVLSNADKLGSQIIKYSSENHPENYQISPQTGFDFRNGINTTAQVAEKGKVWFDLDKDLKGIDSISGPHSSTDSSTPTATLTFDSNGANLAAANNGGKVAVGSDGVTLSKASGATVSVNDTGLQIQGPATGTEASATPTVGLTPSGSGADTVLTLDNGTANNPVKLTGLKEGTVDADSKDAVTGAQISTLATKILGVDKDANTAPTFTAVTTGNGTSASSTASGEPSPTTTIVGAVKSLITAVNDGISFMDNLGAKVTTHLGGTLKIVGEADNNVANPFKSAKDNIQVAKNTENDGLEVKLSQDLVNLNSVGGGADKGTIKFGDNGAVTLQKGNGANATPAVTLTPGGSSEAPELQLGANDKPVKLTGLADGDISQGSKDVVTGGQISKLAKDVLGLNADAKTPPTFDTVKGGLADTTEPPTSPSPTNTVAGAIKSLIHAVNGGITFNADTNPSSVTPNALGSTVSIVSGDIPATTADGGTPVYAGDNLSTTLTQENGKTTITIGLKKAPVFDSVTVGGTNGISISTEPVEPAVSADATNRVKFTSAKADEASKPVVLGNVAAGIADNDAVNVKQLHEIANNSTTNITALRVGAGTVVYEDADHKKLVRGNDGKFYDADAVKNLVQDSTDHKWYESMPNGAPDKSKVHSDIEAKTPVQLAVVNAEDDSTTKPFALANLKSALGLPTDATTATTAVSAKKAKEVVSGTADTALLKLTGDTLGKAATLADLQAVAQAGLDFQGNDKTAVHQTLGSTLKLTGETGASTTTTFDSAAGNIQVAQNNAKDGLEIKLSKDLVNLNSVGGGANKGTITFGEDGAVTLQKGNGANATPAVILTPKGTADNPELQLGANDKPVKLTGLADGSIADKSTEVVTGGQISKIATGVLGVKADGTLADNTFEAVKGSVTSPATPKAPTTIVGAVKDAITAINSGLKFAADQGNAQTNQLGSTVKVAGGAVGTEYVGDNLQTNVSQADGNTTITIGLKKAPVFDSVTVGGTEGVSIVTEAISPTVDGVATNRVKFTSAKTGETDKPVVLGNVAKGIKGTDAVNLDQLNEIANQSVTNLTAFRVGAGTVVYEDADHKKLVRGNDGKFYDADTVKDLVQSADGKWYHPMANGAPDTQKGVVQVDEKEPTQLAVVNADGSTTKSFTLANLASVLKLPTDATTATAAVSAEKAKEAVSGTNGLLSLKGEDLGKAATVADLQAVAQAGLDFQGNTATTVHRTLGSLISFVGQASKGATAPTAFAADNLYVDADKATGKLTLKLRNDLQNLESVGATPGQGGRVHFVDGGVTVDNGKAGNENAVVSMSPTNGTDGNPILTLGNGKSGTNAKPVVIRNVADAVEDHDAVNKGQLDAVAHKVQDLQDGVAGNMVYTDKDGNPLVRGADGKYYNPDDIKDMQYVDKKWYANDQLVDGSPKENATTSTPTAAQPISVSLVNPDPSTSTTNPLTLSNLGSNLASAKDIQAAEEALKAAQAGSDSSATQVAQAKLDALKAKAGEGFATRDLGKGASNAATVGDLQVVAQTGMNFAGNDGEVVHKNLGDTLNIQGDSSSTQPASFTSAQDNIKVVQNTAKDGLTVQLNKDLVNIDSIGGKGKGKVSFEDGGITVDNGKSDDTHAVVSMNVTHDDQSQPILTLGNGKSGEQAKPVVIRNVADATEATDAVNLGQLQKAQKEAQDNAKKFHDGVDGTVVYTGDNGTRLVRGADGKYYTPDAIKDMQYVNGNWYNNSQVKPDGTVMSGASPATAPTATDPKQLSLVSPGNPGNTTQPVALGNVQSNIATNKQLDDAKKLYADLQKKADDAPNNTPEKVAATNAANMAKMMVDTLTALSASNKASALASKSLTPNEASKAATLGDVQAVAQTGYNLQSDGDAKDRKPTTVSIGSTVHIKDGINTKVSAVTKDEKTGVISYSINLNGMPAAYVNTDGEQLAKVGNQWYVVNSDGSLKMDDKGAPTGNTTVAGVKLLTTNGDKTPVKLSGVANGDISDNSTDAINGSQLSKILGIKDVSPEGTISIGGFNNVTNVSEVIEKLKDRSENKDPVVHSITIKANADDKQPGVKIVSQIDPDGVQSLNFGNDANPHALTRLSNVAPAIRDTDVPNYGQVKGLVKGVEDAGNYAAASAIATANLPQTSEAGQNTFGAAIGTYGGRQAVAIGFSSTSDNARMTIRSSVTINNKNVGAGVGVGFHW